MNALNSSHNLPVAPSATPEKTSRRWIKALALTAVALVLLIVATVGCLWWWAGTDGSLATALRWLEKSQPLHAETASGSLRAGGKIDRLVWQQDGLTVEARDVVLAWQPWSLLQGVLKLDRLSAAVLEVNNQRIPAKTPVGPPNALDLPLQVVLEMFSVGQLRWLGPTTVDVTGISGRYAFNGLQHQLDLVSAQLAAGRYSANASLSARGPLKLDASVSGALQVALPNSKKPLPLAFNATIRGLLTDLRVNAALKMSPQLAAGIKPAQPRPQASVDARVTAWAAQPLPQADASFRDLDLAALWPDAPQTLLTGSASVRPADTTATTAPISPLKSAWLMELQWANAVPGPWNQQKLPVERLQALGEWRNGAAMVRSLKAQLGGGELLASGEWTGAGNAALSEPAWKLQATLQNVNPAALHSQLAALPLDGQATVLSQGEAIGFEADVQARSPSGKAVASDVTNTLRQLRLRDASATGSWRSQQAGGTLVLSALRIRSDDAALNGQLEIQPAAPGGKVNLALTAPGLDMTLQGELQQTLGGGELGLRGRDAAQALRWLQKLPGMPASIQTASANGSAELTASWQGGWQDPAVQARLELPSLDWRPGARVIKNLSPGSNVATKATTPKTTSTAPITLAAPSTSPIPETFKIRALQATLSGRLSQAQLDAEGRMEAGTKRYAVQLTAEAGRIASARSATLSEAGWQGRLKQLNFAVEDPNLGAGAWRLATKGAVPFKWSPTPAGGAFESGAGEALLSAPARTASNTAVISTTANTTPASATLTWQPVRWRPGEVITAGKLTGLPMAWIELLAGPQLAGAGLTGNLVLDGEWDAVLGDTLRLKASLARSSGDLTVQAETTQGTAARVAAGVKQARISLASDGNNLTLALRWDTERAGNAEGQLKTRLTRAPSKPGAAGLGSWSWAAEAPLNGQLRAQLPRIGVWSVLAPPGWRLRGSLLADVAVSGTRASPQLAGTLNADDLALRSVVDGIEFGSGRLRAQLDGTRMRINEFTLQGAGDKGSGGSLTAQGEAVWLAGRPQVQLSARLERLRASLRTDRQLTISGEVQASLRGDQTELNGKLVVNQARIILPDEGTPQLGEDVVVRTASGIAAGQKAPAETSATSLPAKPGRAIKVAVQLDLGQDFRVQGKGIDTRVRGSLALNAESLQTPRLTGTVNTFGGQYRAYGQRLDVEQGVLRFTGAIDNPTLDILAIRPNLTQRVGVQITGTALLPRVRLYAQPELADAEKLSWLVVGRASATGGAEAALLQQAALALLGSKSGGMSGGLAASLGLDELSFRGASSNADGSTSGGAVTLGKRFTRNFYAAYERSISSALGTLYIFYDLSQRFTVRAQTGQQSAVDLIFTVPYD